MIYQVEAAERFPRRTRIGLLRLAGRIKKFSNGKRIE